MVEGAGDHQRWALVPLGALGLSGIALELLSLQHCHVLLQFQGMLSEEAPLGSPPEQLHLQTHQISAVQQEGSPAAPVLPPAPPRGPGAHSPLFGVTPSPAPPGAQGHGGDTGDIPLHGPGQHTAQHFPWSCPRGAGSPWSRDQNSPNPCSNHEAASGAQWFQPQPLFFQLLNQLRACSAKSHHMPWHQKPWFRVGPPGWSVLMGYLQVQELGITQDHWPWPQPLLSLTASLLPVSLTALPYSPISSPLF